VLGVGFSKWEAETMPMPEVLEIRTTTRVRPVGFCIYCGSKENLSDEHVVPFALGGNVILPDASCPNCAAITSAFEGSVLRGFMREGRTAGRFPTRRPKERPTTLPLSIKRGDEMESIALAPVESPGFLQLPMLESAAFLVGRPPVNGLIPCGSELLGFGKPPDKVAADLKTTTIQTSAKIDLAAFIRMLAKIGYSFAVAAQGPYPLDEVPVLSLILGSAFDGSTWIGSAEYRLEVEAQSPQHALGLVPAKTTVDGNVEEILIAYVKLFANAGATGYQAVVRRRRVG
jgi:hypothetical protein